MSALFIGLIHDTPQGWSIWATNRPYHLREALLFLVVRNTFWPSVPTAPTHRNHNGNLLETTKALLLAWCGTPVEGVYLAHWCPLRLARKWGWGWVLNRSSLKVSLADMRHQSQARKQLCAFSLVYWFAYVKLAQFFTLLHSSQFRMKYLNTHSFWNKTDIDWWNLNWSGKHR